MTVLMAFLDPCFNVLRFSPGCCFLVILVSIVKDATASGLEASPLLQHVRARMGFTGACQKIRQTCKFSRITPTFAVILPQSCGTSMVPVVIFGNRTPLLC